MKRDPGAMDLAVRQLSLAGASPVEFGVGAVTRLPLTLATVGASRALVVTDPGVRAAGVLERVLAPLDEAGIEYGVFDRVRPNPSTDDVLTGTAAAAELLEQGSGDLAVLAVGGGSALDVAKGVGLLAAASRHDAVGLAGLFEAAEHPGLPLVAVPTTAGTGAETNGFAVLADPDTHAKVYLGAASVRPRVAVLDPELTLGVPALVTAATGMDALTHGVESLASQGSSPLSAAYALRAVTLVGRHLEHAVTDGQDVEARAQLLFAAHLAGLALTLSGLGLVHGVAHATTGHTGAAHGLALSAVLDTVMEASAPAATDAFCEVGAALGVRATAAAAVDACRELADEVGARRTLGELGVTEALLPTLAEDALADAVSRNAPWLPTAPELTELLAGRL